jgi:hypothetical protein
MSTAVKPDQPAIPAVETYASTSPAASVALRRPWQQRRYRAAAGALLLAVVAAAVANNVVARQYTPEGAVRQYLGALQSGDASKAWGQIQVAAPTQPAKISLIDEAALRASLATTKPDIRSFSVNSTTRVDAATQLVAFSYDTSSGTKQAKFTVQQSGAKSLFLYPSWHLIVVPTILQVTLPQGSTGISVDGKALALPAGASTIAVLPLGHRVTISPTQVVAEQTVPVDAFFSAGQTLAYQPALTAAGLDMAKRAVKAAFDQCAQRTDPNADFDGCPQSIGYSLAGSGTWQIVGDPTQDLAVTFDKNMNAVATGHYQLVYGYRASGIQGVQHVPASSGYRASLSLAADAVNVASIQSANDVPTLTRPSGASDQAAKDLVGPAMKRCAAVRAQYVADCPQSLLSVATSVRWTLTGDPLSGARVDFDPSSGEVTVHGNFAMTVSYLFFGNPRTERSFNSAYVAYLLWDGQALQLITIAGSD